MGSRRSKTEKKNIIRYLIYLYLAYSLPYRTYSISVLSTLHQHAALDICTVRVGTVPVPVLLSQALRIFIVYGTVPRHPPPIPKKIPTYNKGVTNVLHFI